MAADEPRGQVQAANPSWSTAALALAAVVVVATAVALLWYPAPRAAWSERLLAALLPTSLVLAAALRLVVWHGHDQDEAGGEGVPRALLALAVGITLVVAASGNAYT